MGIWDRLGNVIRSYLNEDDPFVRSARGNRASYGREDPDLNAAYEELNDYLKGEKKETAKERAEEKRAEERVRPVPEEIRKDFEELGLTPDASAGECKAAYKKLLKLYHPDRHTGDPANLKKATEKSARLNAAYDRLIRWFSINEINPN